MFWYFHLGHSAEMCASALFHLFQVSGAEGGGSEGAARGPQRAPTTSQSMREAKDVIFYYFNWHYVIARYRTRLYFAPAFTFARCARAADQTINENIHSLAPPPLQRKESQSAHDGVAIDSQAPAAIALIPISSRRLFYGNLSCTCSIEVFFV